MPAVQVVVNEQADERVIQRIAACLRANDVFARQVRVFAENLEGQRTQGIQFQPRAGQILICDFGLGFQVPEIVKKRPVLVISPHRRTWSGLCTVIPISSREPNELMPFHFELPQGTIPHAKYDRSWLKGDLIVTVGRHRLDRLKIGFRQYVSPTVPDEVLRAAKVCALHAQGMHTLTPHVE